MTVNLWAIGGFYKHKGTPYEGYVELESFVGCSSLVNVKPIEKSHISSFSDLKENFEGPTHIPCPVCGELQVVRETQYTQITLAEHLDRCHD